MLDNLTDDETEMQRILQDAETENRLRASGSPDCFRKLAKSYGWHPETLAEVEAYETGFAAFLRYAGMPDTAPPLPPRPVWRAPPVQQMPEVTVDALVVEPPASAPDPRDEELAALRARVAELEAAPAEPEAPLLPAPDALMSDYGQVGEGYEDVTGDMLLDAFEQDEAEAVAVIQVLSATRQRHLSEQLNVEKARLRREHMLTDQANPREASIDRLLGLLTRRGD
jgi:hypothetical protein